MKRSTLRAPPAPHGATVSPHACIFSFSRSRPPNSPTARSLRERWLRLVNLIRIDSSGAKPGGTDDKPRRTDVKPSSTGVRPASNTRGCRPLTMRAPAESHLPDAKRRKPSPHALVVPRSPEARVGLTLVGGLEKPSPRTSRDTCFARCALATLAAGEALSPRKSAKRMLVRPPPVTVGCEEEEDMVNLTGSPVCHYPSSNPTMPACSSPASQVDCSVIFNVECKRCRDPDISKVFPNLFVGTEVAAQDLSLLSGHGITHVLNCTTRPNLHSGEFGAPKYLSLGLFDSTADLPNMQKSLKDGVAFIHSALVGGGQVLVHCQRGISRSCTLAMAYLIWIQRRPAEAVFVDLRRSRSVADPNLGYWCSLKEWEQHVLGDALN